MSRPPRDRYAPWIAACLACGAADLVAANVWLVPRALAASTASAVSAAPRPAPTPAPVARRASDARPAPPTHAAAAARVQSEAPALARRAAEDPRPESAPAGAAPGDGVLWFATGDWRPESGAAATVAQVATALQQHPRWTVLLAGHADARGRRSRNRALSVRRARAVATYLTQRGVARARIRVRGYGATRPLDSGTDDRALARNRRVEVYLRRGGS